MNERPLTPLIAMAAFACGLTVCGIATHPEPPPPERQQAVDKSPYPAHPEPPSAAALASMQHRAAAMRRAQQLREHKP